MWVAALCCLRSFACLSFVVYIVPLDLVSPQTTFTTYTRPTSGQGMVWELVRKSVHSNGGS